MGEGVDAVPPGWAALRERVAELADLRGAAALLHWDQHTTMPPAGAAARADRLAALDRVIHERLTDPALARLLDDIEPWAAGEDPDSDAARLVAHTRRDHEKAVRVPATLAVELTRAASLGQEAWLAAFQANDFGRFREALERQVELRHRYVACFPESEHPYDVLLDDYEPGMRTSEVVPVLAELRDGLAPFVRSAAAPGERPRNGGVFQGPWSAEVQRGAALDVLDGIGWDPAAWRLDPAPHPFAMGMGRGDTRITTRYDEHDFGMALYSVLHEFGHGLYDASYAPALDRTTLDSPASLAVHESQSRLWENLVGRGRPFCAWVLPRLRETLGAGLPDGLDADGLFRAVNAVSRSSNRVEADETTYNLHVVLRFELELGLIDGSIAVADLPAVWNDRMWRDLEVEVRDDRDGVLQDIHWGMGAIGYFATYTLGNLVAAQLWRRIRRDLPDLDASIEGGDFAPLRAWLGEHVHQHGRKFHTRELLARTTGEALSPQPFLEYLGAKLAEAAAPAA
jgi:carboxypeptidase Taq